MKWNYKQKGNLPFFSREELSKMIENNRKWLELTDADGNTEYVRLMIDAYENSHNIYIGLEHRIGGHVDYYADITTDKISLPYMYAAVHTNDYDETLPNFIQKYKLGEYTVKNVSDGYFSYPVYKFDEERLKELDPLNFQNYIQKYKKMKSKENLNSNLEYDSEIDENESELEEMEF